MNEDQSDEFSDRDTMGGTDPDGQPYRHNAEQHEAHKAALNDMGKVSDGYHTFDELYDHRCTLFLALMRSHPGLSWISAKHSDGSAWPGWFVAGMRLPTGDVTYHLPAWMWSLACSTGAAVLEAGHEWDGHTPADVVKRLQAWLTA